MNIRVALKGIEPISPDPKSDALAVMLQGKMF